MARTFKRNCRECGERAIVLKTEHLHDDLKREYCQCQNPKCKHKWVNTVTFEYTLRESDLSANALLQTLVEKLSLDDVKRLQIMVDRHLKQV